MNALQRTLQLRTARDVLQLDTRSRTVLDRDSEQSYKVPELMQQAIRRAEVSNRRDEGSAMRMPQSKSRGNVGGNLIVFCLDVQGDFILLIVFDNFLYVALASCLLISAAPLPSIPNRDLAVACIATG